MKKNIINAAAFAIIAFKLPYPAGTSLVVTQGYHSPPTHVGKDDYALDLTGDACDAYGTPVVAAVTGKVIFAREQGYNGGYGTEILIETETASGTMMTRYAHLIPGSIVIPAGEMIAQGDMIGLIGNTGLTTGDACAVHPGTHLHFAADMVMDGGALAAYDPEPISGYSDITQGKWYRSDNGSSLDVPALLMATTTITASTGRAITTVTTDTAPADSGEDDDLPYCP